MYENEFQLKMSARNLIQSVDMEEPILQLTSF